MRIGLCRLTSQEVLRSFLICSTVFLVAPWFFLIISRPLLAIFLEKAVSVRHFCIVSCSSSALFTFMAPLPAKSASTVCLKLNVCGPKMVHLPSAAASIISEPPIGTSERPTKISVASE